MGLKVFHVTAYTGTLHLNMIAVAENKEEALELAKDRVDDLIRDCPSMTEFQEACYMVKEFDATQKSVIDIV